MESRTTSFGEGDSEGHTGLAVWPLRHPRSRCASSRIAHCSAHSSSLPATSRGPSENPVNDRFREKWDTRLFGGSWPI